MAGVPMAPFWRAMLAWKRVLVGVHSVGMPSVASTSTCLRSGLAMARVRRWARAPVTAGVVGVVPCGTMSLRAASSAGAAPGRSATGTTGVSYAPASQPALATTQNLGRGLHASPPAQVPTQRRPLLAQMPYLVQSARLVHSMPLSLQAGSVVATEAGTPQTPFSSQ